jgi:hypothetical protein
MRRALAIVSLSASVAAADPPCKPSARVTGERAIVDAIDAELRERGVAVAAEAPVHDPAFADAACRPVAAEVATGGHRIMVWIADGEDRRVERLTEDVPAAATLIESWARRDIIDPLFAARGVIPMDGAGAADAARIQRDAAPAAPAAPPPGYMLAGGADVGVSGDGGLWSGVRAQACGRIGRICLGGVVRYAFDLEQSGDAKALGTTRSALDVTITADLPVHRGAIAIVPGLGLGVSALTATLPVEEEVEQAVAFHARGAIALGYAVSRGWSLRADLALAVAPFARERLGEPDGIDRQLAASPKLQAWLGLGAAYGGHGGHGGHGAQ